jgi:hypothetical protein
MKKNNQYVTGGVMMSNAIYRVNKNPVLLRQGYEELPVRVRQDINELFFLCRSR